MSDHDTLLSEFVGITNIDEERAKFYLESSAWQLQVALASYYENDENIENPEEEFNAVPVNEQSSPPENVAASKSIEKSKTSSKFATVNSLNSSSSDEEGQAFYAGGSEHSGQQVLGPSKKKKDIVSEMFKSVQEHGAEIIDPQKAGNSQVFGGTGYKLGQSANDTEVVAGASRQPTHTEVTLKLWSEGFSMNDGVLRNYSDPNNKEFLDYIRKGEIPPELVREARGSEVHLSMEDHRHEDYIMSKPKLQPFSGKGHTLGSVTPAAVGAPHAGQCDKESNESQAKQNVKVDKAQPTTNVQIRLADGSRLIGEFNHAHTVADVRSYIIVARPQYEHQDFVLLTTFPNKELSDGSQTLKEAGLLNAAILQRLQ